MYVSRSTTFLSFCYHSCNYRHALERPWPSLDFPKCVEGNKLGVGLGWVGLSVGGKVIQMGNRYKPPFLFDPASRYVYPRYSSYNIFYSLPPSSRRHYDLLTCMRMYCFIYCMMFA